MSDADKIKAIQQRMKQVRRELGNDVATSARHMTDWRSFVRATPWACIATAAAVGYFLVPKGPPLVRLSGTALQSLMREQGSVLAKAATNGARPGLGMRVGRSLLSHFGGLAFRGLMAYVGHRFAKSQMPSASHQHEEDAQF